MKVFLAMFLASSMMTCGGSPPAAPVGNRAGLWKIIHSNSMPSTLSKSPGAIGKFNFPVNIGFVGYVMSAYVGPRPSTITMTFRIDGNGMFDSNWSGANGPSQGCFNPASVTVIVQKVGDDLTGEDGRWWAGTQVLTNNNGVVAVVIPVDPDHWVNAMGKIGNTRVEGFEATMKNLGHVGFTFGGGCNYGHGVRLSLGASTFTLISYEVK